MRKQRVEAAVRQAWQAQRRSLRQRRLRWSLAAAASLALAVLGAYRLWPMPAPASVAVLVHVEGEVLQVTSGGTRRLAVGDRIPLAAEVRSAADASAAFSLDRVASLRLRGGSRLRWDAADRIVLERGEVYLDSGERSGGIVVETAWLKASDVGTRFSVRHTAQGSAVLVRDGAVAVEARTQTQLGAGERIDVDATGGVRRGHIAAHAQDWQWARSAAVPFDANGRTLRELLTWYAHESGLRLLVAAQAELAARLDTPLHGALGNLDAAQLLDVARAAGPLQIREDRERGELEVSL